MKTLNIIQKEDVIPVDVTTPRPYFFNRVEPIKNSVPQPVYRFTSDTTPELRDAGEVITDAILTESGNILTTENGNYLSYD